MEQEKYENAPVGEEMPPIQPEPCTVTGWRIETIQKDGKDIGPKLTLICEHPTAGNIELSGVKYESGDKLKTAGLWLKLDKSGKIVNPSATSAMLKHYFCQKIADLRGKTVKTCQDERGYLIVRAY